MNATIVHRGPDGEGQHVDACVGIGMRRLSIIDLDGGWQPISNEARDIHVVQNGEIYNYQELRRELTALGHRFATQSDTEAIVHAYEQWGGRFFAQHLRGMFGIAIWDSRRQELWLARDRLGIKPLFYVHNAKGFAFGSEVKALLASPTVDPEIEPAALSEYLTFGSADVGRSFIKGINQLLPGCVLKLSVPSLDVAVERYWEFTFPESRTTMSQEEAEEALDQRLRDAVKQHLIADVPIGAFLSGGVDSSAIVGLAAEQGAQLSTFSIGFHEQKYNELPFAREVAKKWACDHHEWVVTPDAVQVVGKLVEHLDEPFADSSAIPTWYVSQLAAEHVKVVLSGDGGDELFAGYERFSIASRRLYLDSIPRLLRKFGATVGHLLPNVFPGRYFLEYAALDRAARYASELCHFPVPQQAQLLRTDFQPASLGVEHPLERAARTFREFQASDYLSRCMQLDTTRYLPMDILVKVDRMTMAHGLEARPPLLDHEFVEFVAGLPTEWKFRPPNQKKILLRKVARRVVPAHLMDRRKAGFSVPLQQWFSGPLLPMFEDTVLNNGRCLTYLRPAAIRDLISQNRAGRRNYGLQLWSILMLELWLRKLSARQANSKSAALV